MDDVTTATLALRPPEHRVEKRAVRWWALQSLLVMGPLVVVAVVVHLLATGLRPWTLLAVAATSVLLVVGVVVEPLWRYRVHRWEVTDDAVFVRTGWVVREWRAAPISRVQTVDAVQGPVEQLLGLSTVRVTTASSRGAVLIAGLDAQVATALAARLTEITQDTPGDAT